MRRSTGLAGFVAGICAMWVIGCASSAKCPQSGGQKVSDKPSGRLIHCVFFTCKEGTPDSEIDSLVADAYNLLAKVPGVKRVDSGRRDERLNREVNNRTYTVGLLVEFDDKAGHDIYADHPTHMEYVNKHKEHWTKVEVFDYVAK
mgnify:CR=1 FL=1